MLKAFKIIRKRDQLWDILLKIGPYGLASYLVAAPCGLDPLLGLDRVGLNPMDMQSIFCGLFGLFRPDGLIHLGHQAAVLDP